MHFAAVAGHEARVRLLIARSADDDKESEHGWTALYGASLNSRTKIARVPVERGVDSDANNSYGRKLLSYSAKANHINLAALLLSDGADLNVEHIYGPTWSELSLCIFTGRLDGLCPWLPYFGMRFLRARAIP